jgi:hypothetical protein
MRICSGLQRDQNIGLYSHFSRSRALKTPEAFGTAAYSCLLGPEVWVDHVYTSILLNIAHASSTWPANERIVSRIRLTDSLDRKDWQEWN